MSNRGGLTTACTVLAMLAAGCGAGSSSSASPPTTGGGVSVTVPVVVVHNNVLGQSCEALSGEYKALHTGAVVTLEDSSSHAVGRGRLGAPPSPAPGSLCAWGASIKATVHKGESYTVVVGDRWTKDAQAAVLIAGKQRVVITAK